MSANKLESGDGLSLVFNIILHATILFAIWTLLFNYMIKPLTRQIFIDQFKSIIGGIVDQTEDLIPAEVKEFIKNSKINDVGNIGNLNFHDRIKELFSLPSDNTKTKNSFISGISYIVPLTGVGILVFMTSILATCNVQLPIKHIMTENAITFALIGVLEYFLFTQVVLKVVPVPPSTLSKTIIEQFKKDLNC